MNFLKYLEEEVTIAEQKRPNFDKILQSQKHKKYEFPIVQKKIKLWAKKVPRV